MFNKLPVGNLSKLNWWISVTCAILAFIFLVSLVHVYSIALFRSLEVFVLIALITFCNLFLRLFFFEEINADQPYVRLKFYLSSYVLACLIWQIIKYLYSWISGEHWEGEANPVMATLLGFLSIFMVNTFVIVFQSMIILQHKKNKGELENLQLKANESEITNLLLRQQVHPHFLFNSLNTIKSLYRSSPEQGQKYLVHLANFLRVSLSNHQTKTTLLKNEIAFCLDYLKMQSIRFDTAFSYSINISEQTANTRYLPYFSLQPLLENAIKHNHLTEQSPVIITVDEDNGYIIVANNIQPKAFKEASTGNGLANLSERYRLLGAEKINISTTDGLFKVRIKILDL